MSSAYQALILASNPLNYLRLNETSGSAAVDLGSTPAPSSGYLGTFTLNNQPGAILGDPAGAAGWTGVSGSGVSLQANAEWNIQTVSVEFWVKSAATGQAAGLVDITGGANVKYLASLQSGFLIWQVGFTDASVPNVLAPDPTPGAWTHAVCTYDGANLRTYVNGVLKGTTAKVGTVNSSSTATTIGLQGGGSSNLNGEMQEVAIYTTVLSQPVIASHYRQGALARSGIASASRNWFLNGD